MKSKSADKIKMPSIDELLGVSGEESATDIEISRIHSFANHPFKVLDDDKMDDLVESIKQNGVLTPVLVRPDKNNSYEMISGHRRMHAAINIDSLIQIKNALITGCNNWITIDDIPRNNGKLYQKFYDKNDNIEYNMIWDTLIKKFRPISDDDYYNDKFKYKLSNILRGNRKNIEPDLWNDMLKCLLYLSNTDEKNPQQYFYSQFMSYLKDKIDPLELPILPDLDGAIAEYNQKKKQEQSGN